MIDPNTLDTPINQLSEAQFQSFYDELMGKQGIRERSVVTGTVLNIADDWVTIDIAYKADLVGIDHVGLGIDYYLGQHPVEDLETATRRYNGLVAADQWRPDEYPPPPYIFPNGIETPQTRYNLGPALAARGFNEEERRKILGGNWLRVLGDIWGG